MALVRIDGHLVQVETDIANGLIGMVLVGFPDIALRQARDRIRAAVLSSGQTWPQRRVTVGLSPANLPTRDQGFDLAVAVVLPAAAPATATGFSRVVVAVPNARGHPRAGGAGFWLPPRWRRCLLGYATSRDAAIDAVVLDEPPNRAVPWTVVPANRPTVHLAEILGQPVGRRAAETCAADGHHLWLLGCGHVDEPRLAWVAVTCLTEPADPVRSPCWQSGKRPRSLPR